MIKKVLVYGETEREARKFYPAKDPNETVGWRTYAEYGNGEKSDDIVVVDEKKLPRKTKAGKPDKVE